MKKILLSVFIFCGLTAFADGLNFQWGKTVISPMSTNPHSLAKSADDKVFAFSSFGSSGDADSCSYGDLVIGHGAPYNGSSSSGNSNIVLQKLEKTGECIWSIYSCWGGVSLADCAYTPTSDGGAFLALKFYHTDSDAAGNGKLLSLVDATGKTTDVIWEYPGYWVYQGILAKISADGDVEWTRTVHVDYSPEPAATNDHTSQGFYFYGAATDDEGNLYIGGNYRKEMTFAKKSGETVLLSPHNTEGWTGDSQAAVGDLFLVKLDEEGYYLGHITTTGKAVRENIDDIVYADGKIYFLGMIKGSSTENLEVKLGDTAIHPTEFDDILVGAVNTDMSVAWVKHFPAFGASNGKHTTQNKKIDIQDGSLYLTGHIVGGFGCDKSEALIAGSSTLQSGFLIKCSAADGTWEGGAVGDKTIGGYYGAFENKDGKIFTFGYVLGEVYLITYDSSSWEIENEYSLISGGMATAWSGLFDGQQFLAFSRSQAKSDISILNGTHTLEKPANAGNWMSILTSFEIPDLGNTSGLTVQETLNSHAIKVYGGKNQIVIEVGEYSDIQILNICGQMVKSITVTGGKHVIALPKGVYIVNRNKVVVY